MSAYVAELTADRKSGERRARYVEPVKRITGPKELSYFVENSPFDGSKKFKKFL
ncbi:hypothetical protein Pmar_PMAR018710 [Perkinsus marinus ATCC 50983]|uniref:Uncharacterized protein n=1 Tax=Perkinsus marinus (strain ATCC 50983 / TXsc) TaxID=423536 RepID=C5K911_PERM5|nr:hypothetical protein Pmar_PMAR018710 [Perkinsus marinus ATCC 50983]EER19034.1 hypothetical protein Pmar_PMAR018710 [Perkinsus marinus ATCC 50983]|eukprot:XP_002787238.1 hypothetical protein Pmar_PMAR018710 [Perkinsus marinus ATCC 50983]